MNLRKHFLLLASLIIFALVLASCGFFKKECEHEYTDEVISPTCAENGYTIHTCSKCQDSYTDSTVSATGHSYVSAVTPNTCTEGGYTTHVCSTCQDTYTDSTVSATGHSYVPTVTPNTCTEGGYTTHVCSTCQDTYTDSATAAKGHNYVPTVKIPSCTEPGITVYNCSNCEDSYTDSPTEATGHNYVAALVETSCSQEGYTNHTCSYCGDSYNDTYISKTAHRFNGDACLYCEIEAPTDIIIPNTEWYNEQNMIFTLQTREELAGLAELVNTGTDFLNKIIYLGADIDLGYLEWTPIGNGDHPFIGTFNGNGHTISSLKISTQMSYVGLFGNVTGIISDFIIDNATVYVTDINQYISVVCGYSTADIKNVQVDGYLDAPHSNYVGAIVGFTTAQLSDLSSLTEVVGADYVGGIAGYINCATAVYNRIVNYGSVKGAQCTAGIAGNITATGTLYIELIENYGDVVGTAHTGGIFGYVSGNTSSLIKNCTSSSSVSGEYYVGAIAGESVNVKISECSNKGSSVSASSCIIDGTNYYAYLGGYVGRGYIVEKCTNDSNINYISRGSYVGGIAGYLTHSINECSNNGNVKGYDRVGGLAGYISSGTSVTLSTLTNSGEISGNSYVGGIVGLWNYSNTFVVSGCDNSGSVSGIDHVGGIAGSLAKTSDKLLTVTGIHNSGDITATEGWVGGLFGYIEGNTSSTVQNCTSSANITGQYYVGGLIGQAINLTLKDSTNEGSTITATGFIVEGTENNVYLGGYVGLGYKVSDCINTVNINYNSLGNYVGGIAGKVTSEIHNCTNEASVTSIASYVGGIAGGAQNFLTASNSNYASNLVNNGAISGADYVGGIFGSFTHDVYHGSCGGRRLTTTVSAFQNNGAIKGNYRVGGIVGDVYFNNSGDYWCGVHYHSWDDHNTYSYNQFAASNIVNAGSVSGATQVGEIFGVSWSDGNSTLTTYTILGSITVNGEVLEGEYSVGSNTRLTLSDRVIPEVDTPEETPEDPAEE